MKIITLIILILMTTNNLNADVTYKKATFAGGCFWCMEGPFEKIIGVKEVTSGYAGGTKENPTYTQVSSGTSGYTEAVQILYDPSRVNYDDLLNVFWRSIDPTDKGGQFADRGSQYRSIIFHHNEAQKKLAIKSQKKLESSGTCKDIIVTEIISFTTFYPAEDYHQNYYKKCSIKYNLYRKYSGREDFLKKTWKE